MTLRFCTLLLLFFIALGCSPERQLARKIGVRESRMERAVVTITANGEEKIKGVTGQYRVYTQTINQLSRDTALYQQLLREKPGKFVGPIFTYDSLGVYYLRVLHKTPVAYFELTTAQLHQSFGIGDQTFQDKVTAIVAACTNNGLLLKTVLEDYKDDPEIGVGMVMNLPTDKTLDFYLPSIHDFILNAPVYSVDVSDPVEFPGTTITELLQKSGPITYHDEVKYARIDVLNARPVRPLRDGE